MSLRLNTPFLAASAALLTAVYALPASAVQSDAPAAAAQRNASTPNPSVIVWNQKVEGKTVKLTYAYLPKDGFVVIYGSDAAGKMSGQPLGNAAIPAGDHRDVKVTLTTEPKKGSKLWATLYEKTDKNGKFDDKDQAVWKSGELPLQNMFEVL